MNRNLNSINARITEARNGMWRHYLMDRRNLPAFEDDNPQDHTPVYPLYAPNA